VAVARRLLRAHVRRRAQGEPGCGEPRFVGRDGDPEVGQHRVAVLLEQDVLGLDVAVDDPAPVGMLQPGRHPGDDAEGRLDRQLDLALEAVAQGLPLHVRHRVVHDAVGHARVEDREDVRVGEAGGEADLAQEAVRAEGGCELRAHDLEGNEAVVPEVPGEVDGGHAAVPKLALDAVAVAEGGGECRRFVGQGDPGPGEVPQS
jgi:hypothetical protein